MTRLTQSSCHYCLQSSQRSCDGSTRHAVGATMPNLNEQSSRQFRYMLPPLSEQKAIAEILGALDAKIELNRRMNQTLESLARAIFKSWFVDFDPVRAKMDGRPPPGLDPATAALFPDSFEHPNRELIPTGWELMLATNHESCSGQDVTERARVHGEPDRTFCWMSIEETSASRQQAHDTTMATIRRTSWAIGRFLVSSKT